MHTTSSFKAVSSFRAVFGLSATYEQFSNAKDGFTTLIVRRWSNFWVVVCNSDSEASNSLCNLALAFSVVQWSASVSTVAPSLQVAHSVDMATVLHELLADGRQLSHGMCHGLHGFQWVAYSIAIALWYSWTISPAN